MAGACVKAEAVQVGLVDKLACNHHRVTNMLLKDFLSLPTTEFLLASNPDRVNDPDHPNDDEGDDRGDEDIDEIRWDSELDAAQTGWVSGGGAGGKRTVGVLVVARVGNGT